MADLIMRSDFINRNTIALGRSRITTRILATLGHARLRTEVSFGFITFGMSALAALHNTLSGFREEFCSRPYRLPIQESAAFVRLA